MSEDPSQTCYGSEQRDADVVQGTSTAEELAFLVCPVGSDGTLLAT